MVDVELEISKLKSTRVRISGKCLTNTSLRDQLIQAQQAIKRKRNAKVSNLMNSTITFNQNTISPINNTLSEVGTPLNYNIKPTLNKVIFNLMASVNTPPLTQIQPPPQNTKNGKNKRQKK